jgi:hypothetical protein
MTAAICIDFGTSSIRAAFRDANDELHVIPLGQLAGERRLDGASLMSEIFVDRKNGSLSFGEKAYMLGRVSSRDAYSKSSAKLWLKDPSMLSQIEVQEFGLTREQLLVGLLAYAFSVTLRANSKLRLQGNIRVAHPIWEQDKQHGSNLALLKIATKAISLAESGFRNPLPVATLQRVFRGRGDSESVSSSVDVIEPIAAAQQLIPHQANLRKIVAVVDVGAGTTDLGLFEYKEPSVIKGEKLGQSAIVPLTHARSVIKAGNLVDKVLLRLLFTKALRLSPEDKREAEAEARRLKEQLFKEGKLTYLGCTIEQRELEQDEDLQEFARDVRAHLEQMIAEKTARINAVTLNQAYQVPYIEVIMAGGGASLSFLVEKLSEPMQGNGLNVAFRVLIPGATVPRKYEADIGRLAVALGGVQSAYDDLRKEYEVAPWHGPTLGSPKQTVTDQVRAAISSAAHAGDANQWRGSPAGSSEKPTAAPLRVGSPSLDRPASSFPSAATPTSNPTRGDKVSQWHSTRSRLVSAAKTKDQERELELALHLLTAPTEQLRRMYYKSAEKFLLALAQNDCAEAAFQLAKHHSDQSRRYYFLHLWKSYGVDRHSKEVMSLESEISRHLTPSQIIACKTECEKWIAFKKSQRLVKSAVNQFPLDSKRQSTVASKQVDSSENLLSKLDRLVSKYRK